MMFRALCSEHIDDVLEFVVCNLSSRPTSEGGFRTADFGQMLGRSQCKPKFEIQVNVGEFPPFEQSDSVGQPP
jgi:hypothetical protein